MLAPTPHPSIPFTPHHPPPSIIPPSIYILQEELRAGFARYEFSALRLAFGLAGKRQLVSEY
jgi:hypothetical protein